MSVVDTIKEGLINELRRIHKELRQQGLDTADPQEWNRFVVLFWGCMQYLRPQVDYVSKDIIRNNNGNET